MGLFDKKYCDVCGEKIGLLGNRKLEDGNLCKNCAAKLSPFFRERKNSTVAEIKEQLDYREENKARLSSFRATKTFGNSTKIYVDESAGTFIVTRSPDWNSANPDIISFSQVRACNTNISENKNEIMREDADGREVSYNPPRYEYSYDFTVEILVDSKWFSRIEVELSDGNCPDSKSSQLYRDYENQLFELTGILTGKKISEAIETAKAAVNPDSTETASPAETAKTDNSSKWICVCGGENTGKFCEYCGTAKPAE
ncbi:MAG: DUF4428 domain-containing protein [Eubacteriales bacterium]